MNKVKKIRTIRTGSAFYKVEYVKDLEDDGRPLLGRLYPDNQLIVINKSLPTSTQLRATHHESTHAISYEYNFGWSEKKVNMISKAFYAFILNNPEFVRQILKYGEKVC